jgi:hypothetical protein
MVVGCQFQNYFIYIAAVDVIAGRNQRKPQACRKSVTNFHHNIQISQLFIMEAITVSWREGVSFTIINRIFPLLFGI